MALTATQRADVRAALGWSARFHQFDSRLEQAMNALDTEPEHETQVIALLANIASVETALEDVPNRLKATKVGSIELDALNKEMTGLRLKGMRHVGKLAAILGVEVRHNIFGSSTPKTFAGFGGLEQGSSKNFIG